MWSKLIHLRLLSFISYVVCTMNVLRSGISIPRVLRPSRPQTLLRTRYPIPPALNRGFHATSLLMGSRSQILKDVGEGQWMHLKEWFLLYQTNWLLSFLTGITEVQIIQWYVEEGAHIEEWAPLCQYQSDKAVDDVSLVSDMGNYHFYSRSMTQLTLFPDYIEIWRCH